MPRNIVSCVGSEVSLSWHALWNQSTTFKNIEVRKKYQQHSLKVFFLLYTFVINFGKPMIRMDKYTHLINQSNYITKSIIFSSECAKIVCKRKVYAMFYSWNVNWIINLITNVMLSVSYQERYKRPISSQVQSTATYNLRDNLSIKRNYMFLISQPINIMIMLRDSSVQSL